MVFAAVRVILNEIVEVAAGGGDTKILPYSSMGLGRIRDHTFELAEVCWALLISPSQSLSCLPDRYKRGLSLA